jgi:hypothetical protein
MKFVKFFFALALVASTLAAPAQNAPSAIDKYFKQYVDDDRFTVVYVSSKLLGMFQKLNVQGLEMDDRETKAIIDLASDLDGIRILVAEQDAGALYKEAKSKINTKEYEVLMTVRDEGENVEFLIKDDGDKTIHELLLMVGGTDEFVLMSFVGRINLDKISQLITEFDKSEKNMPAKEQKQ